MFNVKLVGMDKLNRKIDLMLDDYNAQVVNVLLDGGEAIKATVETDMRSPKSGRMYGSHQASAPGEAPAVEYQDLIGSIVVDLEELKVIVGSPLPYGRYLEFGTHNMEARPWLNPATDKVLPAILNRLKALRLKQ